MELTVFNGKVVGRSRGLLAALLLVLGALAAGRAGAATFTINMSNFQFVPPNQTVSVGDTITWVNQDFSQHDTTSGVSGVPSGFWHSQLLSRGGSFSFTFNLAPGTYPYYCTPHWLTFKMVGTITVVAPNQPPTVSIRSPASGASFTVGSSIVIQADATDSDGSVARVDFFANGAPIGSSSGPTFSTSVNNLAAGVYSITAVAVDNAGATASSAPVTISVVAGNAAPSVTITNPVNGSTFFAGTNVLVEASATDSDGSVAQVRFQLNGAQIGVVSAPPFAVLLTNLAVGTYTLGATAIDDRGASGDATPVQISVVIATSSPQIQTPPRSQTVPVGTNVEFSVVATGTEPLAYQWRFNDSDIPGATGSTFSLINVQLTNGGLYSVLVSNAFGSVVSPSALLQVIEPSNAPPTAVLINPTNGAVFPLNSLIHLSATTADTDGSVTQLVFQIRPVLSPSNSIAIAASDLSSASMSNLPAGFYFISAQATDDRGATGSSPEITFTVQSPPTLVLSPFPTNDAVALGQDTTLTLSTAGPAGAITNASLFDNGVLLASNPALPFTFVWHPAATGPHSLSASATDQLGQTATAGPVLITVFTPEQTRPTLVITNAPRNFGRFYDSKITIGGTASDAQLKKVEYQINDAPPQPAQGRERWLIETNLVPGMNVIRVRSVDLANNISFEATRFLTLVVTTSIVTTVVGNGTLSPDLSLAALEIGKVYRVKARAGAESVFAGWQGLGLTNNYNPVLDFQLVEGMTNLVAVFTNNPFATAAGSYNGLFFNTNQPTADTSGFLNLRLQKSGAFSGKVSMNGAAYPFRGQFSPDSEVNLAVMRRTLTPIVLSLKLDAGQRRIAGFVTNAAGSESIVSSLALEQNPFSSRSNPAPYAGNHPFTLQDTNGPASAMMASGNAQVGSDGMVKTTGMLASGLKFTFTSSVGATGKSPFYVFTARENRALAGWFTFGESGTVAGEFLSLGPGTNHSAQLELTSP